MKKSSQIRGRRSAAVAEPELDDLVAARHPVIGKLRRIARSVPAEAWRKLPADLSANVDHYLYGFSSR